MEKIFNYRLANSIGYKFNIAKIGEEAYDPLAYFHKNNFPDVLITRPSISTDLSALHKKALLSVNGYFYKTSFVNNKLYIPNGTLSMLKSRNNSIGILSFNNLTGDLKKTDIVENMLSREAMIPMFNKVIITFNRDIGNCILILAGYMIFEHPEFFYRVSSNSFALRLDKLNYVEKLYELNRYRDIFLDLNIPVSNNNSSVIDGSVARSDESITKFLTLDNSFLVEIPVTTLTTRKVYLEHSNVPGNFRTEVEPTMPIMVGYGKMCEYFKKHTNDTKYTVYINDAYYNNFIFTKLSTNDIDIYNAHREPGNTYKLSQAFFLEIKGTE